MRNSDCDFPLPRITINPAPADLTKAEPEYDLSMAVAILLSSGRVSSPEEQSIFLGELSLNIRKILHHT